MSVQECQEKISVREFQVWMYRMAREIDNPSRTDWYLMRVCAEINKLVKLKTLDKSETLLTDFQLGTHIPKPTEEEKQEAIDRAKLSTEIRIKGK